MIETVTHPISTEYPNSVTTWTCPECGGICSSVIDHICPLDERMALAEKGLVELKEKRKYTKRNHFYWWKLKIKRVFRRGR